MFSNMMACNFRNLCSSSSSKKALSIDSCLLTDVTVAVILADVVVVVVVVDVVGRCAMFLCAKIY